MDFYRKRRLRILLSLVVLLGMVVVQHFNQGDSGFQTVWSDFIHYDLLLGDQYQTDLDSLKLLASLPVKNRAPKTGYDRKLFSNGWGKINLCDARNAILKRDLTDVVTKNCLVLSGQLIDPYTGREILFQRGVNSNEIQIDHVVAVGDAWQKGAQQLSSEERQAFYNDPLNLLAVSKQANQDKIDSDAASWLPPNKNFRCQYAKTQIAVKAKYNLWVTEAEKTALKRQLDRCPKTD